MLECIRGKDGRLILAFASVLLFSGILVPDVFAMGPSSCGNPYNGQIVVAKINNGTQTFDPLANPGVTFEVNTHASFGLWEVIDLPSHSSWGKVIPGGSWYSWQNPTYSESTCLNGYPNENLTFSSWMNTYGGYINANGGFGTAVNEVHWTIDWVNTQSTANTNNSTIPSTPTNLSAWGMSSSTIVLGWNAPVNYTVTGYKIERSLDGGNTWSTTASDTNTTVTAYTDSGLRSHTTYYYRVSAINKIGTSTSSSETYGTTFYPTLTVKTQDINGNPISGSNATFSQNGDRVASASTPTTFTLTNNQNYDLNVSNIGNYIFDHWKDTGSTDATRDVSITSDTTMVAIYDIIPQPPAGLTATSASSSQINLSWTAPSNNGGSSITGYMIERSKDNGTTWSTIQSNTGSASTTYSDIGLAHSTTYTYRVSAINSAGTSTPSNTASATTFNTVPTPPTGLTATPSLTQINLAWNASGDNGGTPITGYKIERSTDGGTTWTLLVANTASSSTTYSDSNVFPLTTYTYRVSAINSVGTSGPSNTASASTISGGLSAPPPSNI